MTVNIARPCVAAVLVACAVALSAHIAGCNSCSEKPDAEATAEAALDQKGGVAVKLELDDEAQARAVKLLSKMSKGRFPKRVASRKDNSKYFLYLAAKSQNPEVVVAALEAMKVAYAPSASARSEKPAATKDYGLVVAAHLKSQDPKIQLAAIHAAAPLLKRKNADRQTIAAVANIATSHKVVGGRIEAVSALARVPNFLGRPDITRALLKVLDQKSPALLSHTLNEMRRQPRSAAKSQMLEQILKKARDLIKHKDPAVRGRALRLAASLSAKDQAVRAGVQSMLDDKHAYARSCAALAASLVGDPAAIHMLATKLNDTELNRYSIRYKKLTGERGAIPHGPAKEPVNDPVVRAIETLSRKLKEPFRRTSKKRDSASMKNNATAAKAWYEKHKEELPAADTFSQQPPPAEQDEPDAKESEQKSGQEAKGGVKAAKGAGAPPAKASQPPAGGAQPAKAAGPPPPKTTP